MKTLGTIIIAVLVFGVLILIHELGHFLAAKAFKVRVMEFAIGMGPVVFRKTAGETQYSVRLLPVGGFVSMEGETEASNDQRAFCTQKVWKKFIIIAAGAIMNIVLGLILLAVMVARQPYIGSTVIARFDENATSSQMLQVGDEILKINGSRTRTDNDVVYALLRDRDGKADFSVRRDGETVTLAEVPFQMEELQDGIRTISIDFKVLAQEKTFLNSVIQSVNWTFSVVKQVWFALFDLITGQYGLNQLSGPVGTATAIGQASSMGLNSFLMMVAVITVNLGVFNILPIPALDGGRLFFILLEGIRRKPINPKYEGYIHTAGFLLLIGLMLVVTFQDIVKLFVK